MFPAFRAAGRRPDNRFISGNAIDTNIQKTADNQTKNGRKN